MICKRKTIRENRPKKKYKYHRFKNIRIKKNLFLVEKYSYNSVFEVKSSLKSKKTILKNDSNCFEKSKPIGGFNICFDAGAIW